LFDSPPKHKEERKKEKTVAAAVAAATTPIQTKDFYKFILLQRDTNFDLFKQFSVR